MKRTFGKSLVFFILIVLFTLCAAVGCTTLKVATVDDEVPVTNTESSVKMELNRSVLLQGGEVELTITAKMKNDDDASRIWGSAEFWISSPLANDIIVQDWSANSSDQKVETGNVGGAYESKYDIKLDKVTGNANGFLHFYMASNNSSKKVSASVPLIIKIKLKYDENATLPTPEGNQTPKMEFKLDRADYNFIADYNYRGAGSSVETGVLYTASASATNKLVVDDSTCSLELREAEDDSFLESLWVSEVGVPTGDNNTTDIEVLSGETAIQQVSYKAEKASKDSFFIKLKPRQSGAKIRVYVGSKLKEIQPHTDADTGIESDDRVYNIPLNGDGKNGVTKVIISVISEAQLDGSTVTTPTEFDYTLTVTQTYCGLDSIKVTTNENEKLNIAEDKKGLNPDYPNEDNPTTYKVRVPVGQSNGLTGATKVNIVPSVLAGYGISKDITITASNCTASTSSINTNNNGNFDVTGINENSTITLLVNNSQNVTTQITIEFELISINTAIDGALKLTYGDNKEVSASNVGGNFKFELPKASEKEINGVHVRVGDLSATLSVGATFVITQDGEEIEKVGEGDNAKYQLKAGNYAMVVTSAAGNTQSYGIYVENQSVAGDIVRFEFKTSDTDWILVFDLDEVVDSTGRDFSFDTVSKTFTLNGSTDLTDVYFRFALTDDSTLTGLTADSEIVGDGQYGTYKTYTYTYTGLTTGINKKDVKVNSNQAVGSNTYTLEVVNTEQDYQIVGIDIGNDAHNNPLINFDSFEADSTDPSKLTYPTTIEVPFATNKVNFTINAEGHSTQVFINATIQMFRETTNDTADGKKQTIHTREITLQDGKTTKIVITHKGTDGLVTEGTKTYTINIARKAASSDAKLASLEIYLNEENADNADSKLNLAFDPTNTHYLIQLPQDTAVDKVFIQATKSDINATVSGSIGYINLDNISTDTYKFNIIVTPENSANGSGKMIYTIELYAPTSDLETINTLKEFQLIGNDNVNYLTGDNKFEEAKKDYNINVPYSISVFNLIAVAKGNKATISAEMNGTATTIGTLIKLNEGNNTLKVTVTPQNTNLANPMDYIVHITREESKGANAKLETLKVLASTGLDLFAGKFDKAKYDYELTVNSGNQTDKLYINITIPEGALVTITCNNEIIPAGENAYEIGFIDYGTSKTYLIKVALDDSEVTYTLKINREHKIPSLDTLVITQNAETIGLPLYDEVGKDQVSYEKGIYEYTVKISYENVTTLVINTTAQSNVINGTKTYTIDIDEFFNGAAGTLPYEFKIQTGSIVQQYIIHITRLANPASNVTIDNITISKLDSFKFSGDISNYGPYTVENAIDILQPKVECADENASAQIFVNGELANNNIVNLAIGENNIKIVVTAADRVTTKEVYIKVNRKHPSISAVTVTDGGNATIDTGVSINDDINAYSFTVAKDVDKINLNLGLANGYTQTIKSGDPNNLKVGEFNKIVVEVKDNNNQVVRTIEFNVFRENPADYTLWFIIAGVLGGIILILLILTIVAFTKGGNAKKKGNINDIGIGDYELD